MKKLFMLCIALIAILSISFASALSTDATVVIGSDSQAASDYDDDHYGVYATRSLAFDTNDTISIQSISPSSSYYNDADNVGENNLNLSIDSQSNGVISLKGRIPERLSAVDANGLPTAFKVADVIFAAGSATATVEVYMQRESKLEFNKIILVNEDNEEKISNGEEIDELKPGDSGTVEFKVENTYPSRTNIEIDDVEVEMRETGSDELDIDESESMGTIEEDDTATETISYDIDDNADEGSYDILLIVTGEDDYGALHGEQYKIEFTIEKEKDDVSLERLDLNPDSINLCDDRTVTLTVSIENVGENDQDGAEIVVENNELNYYNKVDNIELDEGDATTKRFTITVPESANAGAYRFLVSAKNEDGDVTDSQTIALLVNSCIDSNTNSNTGNNNQQIGSAGNVQVIGPQGSGVTTAQPIAGNIDFTGSSNSKEDDSDIISLALLIVLFIVVLMGILLLIYFLIKK
ncbi:hypothetical protein H6503_05995 [Candidatus Woesearchaeota archaeon]|nr:hypothetical protein [Candidatus Woesearchaeota archaeon]